jgi:hypothetical protein
MTEGDCNYHRILCGMMIREAGDLPERLFFYDLPRIKVMVKKLAR